MLASITATESLYSFENSVIRFEEIFDSRCKVMTDLIRRLSFDYQGGILAKTNRSLPHHVFRENTPFKRLNCDEKSVYRLPPFPNAYTGPCRVFCGVHPWIFHSLESIRVNF